MGEGEFQGGTVLNREVGLTPEGLCLSPPHKTEALNKHKQ